MTPLPENLEVAIRKYGAQVLRSGDARPSAELTTASELYFESLGTMPPPARMDEYFNAFIPIHQALVGQQRYGVATWLWSTALGLTAGWESRTATARLHKGSGYYYFAESALYAGNLDRVMIGMDLAHQEDQVLGREEGTPADLFLRLNNRCLDHRLQPVVDKVVDYLERRLNRYRDLGGTLGLEELRVRLLDPPLLRQPRVRFVASVFRIEQLLNPAYDAFGESGTAAALLADALSSITLVADVVAKARVGGDYMSDHAWKVARARGWTTASRSADYVGSEMAINKNRDTEFTEWVSSLLNGTYGGPTREIAGELEGHLLLGYGLRNFGFHNIESQGALWERRHDVVQAVFNTLFLILEIQAPE